MNPPDAPLRPWKAIAAMARNRVIGCRGAIPWKLPGDLRWVKECTTGKAIAMGRKTYQSLGRPLPKRENIILSRTLESVPGCVVLPDLEALRQYPTDKEIWIFGGAEIYRLALPYVDELFLTIVDAEPEGDAFFPPFEDRFEHIETLREGEGFAIHRYRNRHLPR